MESWKREAIHRKLSPYYSFITDEMLHYLSHFPAASSESFEPTEMLFRVKLEVLWYLHLKEPACVVGEHKQLYFALFGWPEGEDGWFFIPTNMLGTINFFLGCSISIECWLTLDCSAIFLWTLQKKAISWTRNFWMEFLCMVNKVVRSCMRRSRKLVIWWRQGAGEGQES